MTKTPGAEKISDADWKIIEAISDSHQSTLDTKTQKIVDGPLKGLLILKINPALKSVCVRAKLLGVTRDYWLAVRFVDDNGAADVIESKKTAEDKKMAKTTYTEEQLQKALERAVEVGIHKAAEEGGVSWQSLQAYAKKQGKLEEVSLKKKKAATKKAATKPAKKVEKPKVEPVAEATPEATPVAEEKPKRTKKATPATTPAPAPTPAPTPTPEEKKTASALEIENAVLKKENEQLKAKIEKLQKALAELM